MRTRALLIATALALDILAPCVGAYGASPGVDELLKPAKPSPPTLYTFPKGAAIVNTPTFIVVNTGQHRGGAIALHVVLHTPGTKGERYDVWVPKGLAYRGNDWAVKISEGGEQEIISTTHQIVVKRIFENGQIEATVQVATSH